MSTEDNLWVWSKPKEEYYPDWVYKIILRQSDVENHFYIPDITCWLEPRQAQPDAIIYGALVYQALQSGVNPVIRDCLGLRDAEAIRRKGKAIFESFFSTKKLFFWRSVVVDAQDRWFVPYLCTTGAEPNIEWEPVDQQSWSADCPAAVQARYLPPVQRYKWIP